MAYDASTRIDWRPVVGHGDYSVSNTGLVYSHKINRVAGFNNYIGYRSAWIDGKSKYVHRLVAEAFIPNPDNLPCINHKDENGLNNNIDNLEWCDKAYNNRYGTSNARASETKKDFFQTEEGEIEKIRMSQRQKKYLQTKAGKEQLTRTMRPVRCLDIETLDVVRTFPSIASTNDFWGKRVGANIQKCCAGQIKSAYGYRWEYAQGGI